MPASLSEIDEADDSDDNPTLCSVSTGSDSDSEENPQHGDVEPFEGSVEDEELLGRCDYCTAPLIRNPPLASRAFMCGRCDSLQCGRCCHTIHVCKPDHVLLEWDAEEEQWLATQLSDTDLSSKHPTLCGACEEVVTPEGARLPRGTVKCRACECGVLCRECCFKKHEQEPLHEIEKWNGNFWEKTTLRQVGFVYQMGHHGGPCPAPDRKVASLIVITYSGVQRLHVRYCRCPDSEGMAKSNAEQIKKNGWFPSTLRSPSVCCTFRTSVD
ncbi:hypothetical protein DFH06DRAFT_1322977 [Mycena polygramma]|nr:hypothetical protein DFH06DRAFT_1322977 [Mycena polygramma]